METSRNHNEEREKYEEHLSLYKKHTSKFHIFLDSVMSQM